MHLLIPSLAHDIEHERGRDIARSRQQALARSAEAAQPPGSHRSGPRRLTAIVLARISLASAAAVRRLDACIAEDLARPLVSIDGI